MKRSLFIINISRISWMTVALFFFVSAPVISLQEVAAPTFFHICATFIFVLLHTITERTVIIRRYHKYVLLFFFIGLYSTYTSAYVTFDQSAVKYLVLIVLFIFLSGYSYNKYVFKTFIWSYVVLAMILSFIILLSFVFGYPHGSKSEYFLSRYSLGILGVFKNTNYIASFIVLAFNILIYRVFFVRLTKKTLYQSYLALFLIFVAVFLTGTRAALLNMFVCVSIMLLYYIVKENKVRILLKVILGLIILLLVLIKPLSEMLKMYLGQRSFFDDSIRIDTWLYIYEFVKQKVIFGHGIHSTVFFVKGTDYLEYIHNIYLEMICDQGLVSFVVFLIILFFNIRKVKKTDKLFILCLLFVTGFPLLFQNGFIEVNFWRFLLINRLFIDYSIEHTGGIRELLDSEEFSIIS